MRAYAFSHTIRHVRVNLWEWNRCGICLPCLVRYRISLVVEGLLLVFREYCGDVDQVEHVPGSY
jgi:hypothetical protein